MRTGDYRVIYEIHEVRLLVLILRLAHDARPTSADSGPNSGGLTFIGTSSVRLIPFFKSAPTVVSGGKQTLSPTPIPTPDPCLRTDELDPRPAPLGDRLCLCIHPRPHRLRTLDRSVTDARRPPSGSTVARPSSAALAANPHIHRACERHLCSLTRHVYSDESAPCQRHKERTTVYKWWIHTSTHRSPTTGSQDASVPTERGTG